MELKEVELHGYMAIIAKHNDGIWRVGMCSGPNFISALDGSEIACYRMFLEKLESEITTMNQPIEKLSHPRLDRDEVQRLVVMQGNFVVQIDGYGSVASIDDNGEFIASHRSGNLYDLSPQSIHVYREIEDWWNY